MADDTDNTGLGLIVGIVLGVVMLVLVFSLAPRLFDTAPTQVTIEGPDVPAPAPRG